MQSKKELCIRFGSERKSTYTKKETSNNRLRANFLSHFILSIINATALGHSFISTNFYKVTAYNFDFIKYSTSAEYLNDQSMDGWIDRWMDEQSKIYQTINVN